VTLSSQNTRSVSSESAPEKPADDGEARLH
jgi:hypothetical protein